MVYSRLFRYPNFSKVRVTPVNTQQDVVYPNEKLLANLIWCWKCVFKFGLITIKKRNFSRLLFWLLCLFLSLKQTMVFNENPEAEWLLLQISLVFILGEHPHQVQ